MYWHQYVQHINQIMYRERSARNQHDTLLTIELGPVMSKFTSVFKELGTYKELLHTQVEHMLSNRLMEFINVDLHNAKDSRRRFEKAQLAYDQALEKCMSLKRGTRPDIITDLEEDLHNSKSSYERCRFNLVSALMNIEAKKKYEFLESVSAVMDAHLRYFKQGHELFSQMEQFIHQVLTYSLQSKEMTVIERDNLAKRIQEFRTQEEMDSSRSSNNSETSTNGDGIHVIGVNSYKNIEALMQSTTNGEVQTIKQGYLLKRSSRKGDWKRKFFVLDSRGTLYYYKNKSSKQGSLPLQSNSLLEHGTGVLGRFRFSNQKTPSLEEEKLSFRTIDLRTSTIKMDAEQTDLRFCFRIISPSKTYSLQAENGTERTDWIDKITAVIASLLNSPFLKQRSFRHVDTDIYDAADNPHSFPAKAQISDIKNTGIARKQSISVELRSIPGNDVCAECNSLEPEWASLNLGVLLCIECSGVHRNLGVHISKVRSLTLDVKVWEPAILDLFRALGNSYCNSIWEEALGGKSESTNESREIRTSISKPGPRDPISIKEKFIQLKYGEKYFIVKSMAESTIPVANQIWDAVKSGDIRAAYYALVALSADPNTKYDMVNIDDLPHMDGQEETSIDNIDKWRYNPASCARINSNTDQAECLQGCSALHLACHVGNMVMVELLIQFGADINMQDFHGRTPLHHCISKRNNVLAKYLIKRGANLTIKDGGGQTALERAMEFGPMTDEELLILLVGYE